MRWVILLAALVGLAACHAGGSPNSATLVLNNPFWPTVRVQAVITRGDCDKHDPGYIRTDSFTMEKNQTRSISAPSGADICWRHDRNPDRPRPGEWSGWSRATLFPGQSTETDL